MTNEKKTRRLYSRVCTECGCEFTTPKAEAGFCAPPCRMAWHNRARDRGAEVYHILMTCRFDREFSKEEGIAHFATILSNLAGHYRNSDNDKRGGRPSWDKKAHRRLPISYDARGGDGR
jgi:hypothetical protein